MNSVPAKTPLARLLVERIRAQGPITFAEYMRECLYHPEFGYYSRPEAARFADFYTSVDVHPIFARLLARQVAQMWNLLGQPAEFVVAEAAAGVGRLASYFLDFAAREFPGFYSALRYVAVEQSVARRAQHAALLARHLSDGRAVSAATLPETISAGCIFSNELFDAMPVHRVVVEKAVGKSIGNGVADGALREIYVSSDGESLEEEIGPPSTPAIEDFFRRQNVTLQEGQQAEAGLDACRWMEDAGRRLRRGFVLTVDYGHEAAQLFDERHMRGTLMAYSRHRASEDFLEAPGERDLTAHANFTALDLWGRRAGLQRTGCVSQMQFLVEMGRANEFADLYEPDATETEKLRARLMLKTLIFPGGMGETFQVFVQQKGLQGAGDSSAPARLTGLGRGA